MWDEAIESEENGIVLNRRKLNVYDEVGSKEYNKQHRNSTVSQLNEPEIPASESLPEFIIMMSPRWNERYHFTPYKMRLTQNLLSRQPQINNL